MIIGLRNYFKMKAFPQRGLKCGKEMNVQSIKTCNVMDGIRIFEQLRVQVFIQIQLSNCLTKRKI
jgi:hypothetical protein